MLEPCFSCGAPVPAIDGPTHRYVLSSPGCWAVYGELLAREYSSLEHMKKHRLTVDAYAVQHPGRPSPQAVRSVCLHLCSLHVAVELHADHGYATRLLGRLADRRDDFDWLEPPASLGEVTVADVQRATDPETHLAAVERWARSAWRAWQEHHEIVCSWVKRCS